VVAAPIAAYKFGVVDTVHKWTGSMRGAQKLNSAFTKLPAENWVSSTDALAEVGKSPVDPARVLLPALDKTQTTAEGKKAKPCPPELVGPFPPAEGTDAKKGSNPNGPVVVKRGAPSGPPAQPLPKPGEAQSDLTLVETSVSISKDPSQELDGEKAVKAGGESVSQQSSSSAETAPDEVPGAHKPLVGPRAIEPAKKRIETSGPQRGPQKRPLTENAAVKKEAPAKGDMSSMPGSQVPGSLKVTINNYNGDHVKWGLMVILDDSVSMGKHVKPWTPNRSQAAAALVAKLPDIMTPGSQLAVRDFLCNKSETKKKPEPCPSHMIFPWAASPFKKLKEKLETVETGGKNDPCAAAAYSLRKDFSGLPSLSPRVLIVTGGVSKCAPKDVIKALSEQKGGDNVAVDVITLGIGKKSRSGYAALAKKGKGLLLNMDKPADADKTLERYGKILKEVRWEKVEVKGEKAVVSMNPKQEVILAPGTYTVTLPAVANIKPGKRVINNVKIESGKPQELEISVIKGRPVVKFRKK